MMGTWDFIVALYYQMATLPTEGYIASFLIISNCLFFTTLLITLGIIRYKSYLKNKTIEQLTPKLEAYYQDILCKDCTLTDLEISNKYKEIISSKKTFITYLSITVLAEIKHDINYNQTHFNRIVSLLGFDEFLMKKASFSNAIKKYKTLNLIKELEIKSADNTLLPFAFSRNSSIRKEARLSHLILSENNPYRFFEETKDEITHWDSIELIKLLEKINSKGKLENLGRWLVNTENKSLLIFLIKAIGHFKQTEAKDFLIEKMSDKDPEIRSVAINCLGNLKVKEVEPLLIKSFKNEVSSCQKAIVKALENLDTGKSLAFLEESFNTITEEKLRTSIANSIFQYKKGGKGLFNKLKETTDHSKKTILNHIETPLIKFKEYA